MAWHVKHNRALHKHLLVLRVETQSVPWIKDSERLSLTELASNFWRAEARYGFMERPDILALLKEICERGYPLEFDDVTYYVGHETIVPREDRKGLPKWEATLFAAMERKYRH